MGRRSRPTAARGCTGPTWTTTAAWTCIATGSGGSQIWLERRRGAAAAARRPRSRRACHRGRRRTTTGRLDLLGLDAGRPAGPRWSTRARKDYHWQERPALRCQARPADRPQSTPTASAARSSCGRACSTQKQPITQPVTALRPGDSPRADAVRIIWPNGATQGEFELKRRPGRRGAGAAERLLPLAVRLDGHGMQLRHRLPLALAARPADQRPGHGGRRADRRLGQDPRRSAGRRATASTTCASPPSCGRRTSSTRSQLMTVDHPAGTDILVDERFSIPPPPLDVSRHDAAAAGRPRHGRPRPRRDRHRARRATAATWTPSAAAATRASRATTGSRWTSGRRPRRVGTLWLLAHGWIHPTDSSINVAHQPGQHRRRRASALEVPDGHGGWRVASAELGFPEGKIKTMPDRRSTASSGPGMPRRLRLRTNLEIYWDSLAVGDGAAADAAARRGARARRRRPALPRLLRHPPGERVLAGAAGLRQLAGTTQRWLDLTGYYTRFGDVRPLLATVDDRYVIMNAGDELALRFAAPAPAASRAGRAISC